MFHRSPRLLMPALALVAAFGLASCGKQQQVTQPGSSMGRNGIGSQDLAGCPTLVANDAATAFTIGLESGMVAQYRPAVNRMRIQFQGDLAEWSLASAGACIAADIPSIKVKRARASLFLSGTTQSITTHGSHLDFDEMIFPGLDHTGIVEASDAEGNVMLLMWPALAGEGVGAPVIGLEMGDWNHALVGPDTKIDVSFDLTFEQDGVESTIKGQIAGLSMDGTPVLPNGLSIPPCPETLTGEGGIIQNLSADVVQFRRRRLRFEAEGDVASGAFNKAGGCAASPTPTIVFTGGSANVYQAGSLAAGTPISVTATGQPLVFDELLFPGLLIEPGTVAADSPDGHVLELIWPGLAGMPPGPPIARLQLGSWNSWIRTGRAIDVRMQFTARHADGSEATFEVQADNVVLPQQR